MAFINQGWFLVTCFLLSQTTENLGEIKFLEPLGKLGELATQQVYSHRFEFVNQGSQPLEILAVEPSCGCLVPRLNKKTYEPGEKGGLAVEVKPTSQPSGPHTWFALVRYRCGAFTRQTQLQLQAVIRPEVTVQPAVLAFYGSGRHQQEVVVKDQRLQPLSILHLHCTSPLVQAKLIGSDKGVAKILLQTGDFLPPRRLDERITIYTNDPHYAHLQVPITLVGQARSKILASPERITVRVTPGRPVPSTLVRLRPGGDRPLVVAKVMVDDPALTCTWAAGPDLGATLRIQVDTARLGQRNLESSVRVLFREPPQEHLVIPVQITRE